MPIIVSIITYICWRIWACVHKKHWKKEEPSEPSRKRKRSQQQVKEEEEEKKKEGGGVEMISTEKSKTKQTRHKRVPSPWENLSLEEQENRLSPLTPVKTIKSEEAAVKEDGTKIPKRLQIGRCPGRWCGTSGGRRSCGDIVIVKWLGGGTCV